MQYDIEMKPPQVFPNNSEIKPPWAFRKWMGWAIGGVLLLMVLSASCKTIPSGHVGVLTLFGQVQQRHLSEGINFVIPGMQAHVLSVQTQEIFDHAEVPSKEGLTVALEVSVLYRLIPNKVPEIYRGIGVNFKEVLMVPQLRSAIRGVTVRHEAKDLYTSGRELIANQINQDLSKIYGERGIILESVLLRKIELPGEIQKAINAKLAAEQQAEQMKFVLQREQQEAERKRIEATGITQYQKIITEGLSEKLLQWKGIEATEKLAGSTNSKIVIIGSGKAGLPLIMSTQ